MSPFLVALIVLAAAPPDATAGPDVPAGSATGLQSAGKAGPAAAAAEQPQIAPRTGRELSAAVQAALRRWARPGDQQPDQAATEFLALYSELQQDQGLARSTREQLRSKVRSRLLRLADQIARRANREERQAARAPTAVTVKTPADKQSTLAQLVDLIQRTVAPSSWDVNGGPGTIYYFRPSRALVVRQTDEVHGQLSDALQQIQRLNR
jgi:hypothetical protein